MMSASCVPAGLNSVNVYATFDDVAKALAFYKQALHAQETLRMVDEQGVVQHAEMRVGHTLIMLGNACEEHGAFSPQALGGSSVSLYVYVADLAQSHARAVRAGMQEIMPPTQMFWGDEMSALTDPFGYKWSLGHQVKQLSDAQMAKAAASEGLTMEKKA